MRKKSHISLGKYLVDSINSRELDRHRKAFLLGSILPDCKPSFLTKKHEFQGTYEELQESIRELTVDCDLDERNSRVYWRRAGEVIHYLADYFTFPHNDTYTGNLREHCKYEKYLKHYLKYYIISGNAVRNQEKFQRFDSVEELFAYIENHHEEYLENERNVEEDTSYITTVCLQVVSGIYQLLNQKMELEAQRSRMMELAYQAA